MKQPISEKNNYGMIFLKISTRELFNAKVILVEQ